MSEPSENDDILETIKNTIKESIRNYDGDEYGRGYISGLDDIRWAIEGTKAKWNRRAWFDVDGQLRVDKLPNVLRAVAP